MDALIDFVDKPLEMILGNACEIHQIGLNTSYPSMCVLHSPFEAKHN